MEAQLSLKAIEEEMLICQSLVDKFEKELSEAKSQLSSLTERIEVLKALDKVLPDGKSKILNSEDLKDLADERFELAPRIISLQSKIEHFQTLMRGLNQLKE